MSEFRITGPGIYFNREGEKVSIGPITRSTQREAFKWEDVLGRTYCDSGCYWDQPGRDHNLDLVSRLEQGSVAYSHPQRQHVSDAARGAIPKQWRDPDEIAKDMETIGCMLVTVAEWDQSPNDNTAAMFDAQVRISTDLRAQLSERDKRIAELEAKIEAKDKRVRELVVECVRGSIKPRFPGKPKPRDLMSGAPDYTRFDMARMGR